MNILLCILKNTKYSKISKLFKQNPHTLYIAYRSILLHTINKATTVFSFVFTTWFPDSQICILGLILMYLFYALLLEKFLSCKMSIDAKFKWNTTTIHICCILSPCSLWNLRLIFWFGVICLGFVITYTTVRA